MTDRELIEEARRSINRYQTRAELWLLGTGVDRLLALAEKGAAVTGAKAAAFIEGATAQAGDDAIEIQRARLAGVRLGLDAAAEEVIGPSLRARIRALDPAAIAEGE